MIKTVVIDKRGKFGSRLKKESKDEAVFEVSVVSPPAQVEAELKDETRAIIIVGPKEDLDGAIEQIEFVKRAGKEAACVLAAGDPTKEVLQKALRAGFRDVVDPGNPDEVISVIREIAEEMGPEEGAATGTAPGRVITFLSAKGGVGKTVVLTNTAVALAEQNQSRVLLLDLDDQFGDVGVMLGLKPERTVSDLIPVADRLDGDMLESFLTRHESGLEVLLAPTQYKHGEHLTVYQLEKIIEAACEAGDDIIIDTPVSFSENVLAMIDRSDYIFLVTTLDIPSIKSAQIALQTLELLNFPKDNVKLILNRADSKVSLSPSDVERHLKHKIAVNIPSNLLVPRSVNEGEPLLSGDKRTAVAQALTKVADLAKSLKNGKRRKHEEA